MNPDERELDDENTEDQESGGEKSLVDLQFCFELSRHSCSDYSLERLFHFVRGTLSVYFDNIGLIDFCE